MAEYINRKHRRFVGAKVRGARVVVLHPPKPASSSGRGTCDIVGCEKEWELVWHLRKGTGKNQKIEIMKRRCLEHRDLP